MNRQIGYHYLKNNVYRKYKGYIEMKLFKQLLMLSIFCCCNNAFSSGIPTVDFGSIVQLQLEAGEQAKRWTETVKQYEKELKAQRDILSAQTGIRDIAGLIKESASFFRDAKELQKWISNPQKILDMGFDSLSSDLKKIYKSYGLDHLCSTAQDRENSFVAKERKNCEGQIVLMTLRQQQTANNLNSINERVKAIDEIAKKMAKSKDQKESQDLNNAMSIQLALLQADKLKMEVQLQQEKQQRELIEIQQENIMREKMELNKVSNAKW